MSSVQNLFAIGILMLGPAHNAVAECPPLLDHEMQRLGSSQHERLCETHAGKVLLVVNTASQCAFTPQYQGLQKLYQEKKEQGLVVLGFPSNDFGAQEPDNDNKISDFCRINYGVEFPMFSKISVSGANAHPFYKALIEAARAKPRWNFHKYLIGRDGKLINHFYSFTGPDAGRLRRAIDKALKTAPQQGESS
jgi:glutathione peroxidase